MARTWNTTEVRVRCPECKTDRKVEEARCYESEASALRVVEHKDPRDVMSETVCEGSHRALKLTEDTAAVALGKGRAE